MITNAHMTMNSRIFISHAGADIETAEQVAAQLLEAGLVPLIDRQALAPGHSFLEFMETSLSTCDYCLLLWSLNAQSAAWVRIEWEAALCRAVQESRAFLVVGRLDDCPVPRLLTPRIYIDLFPNIKDGLGKLLMLWQQDRTAAEVTKKRVAHVAPTISTKRSMDTLYVTSEYFNITIPVAVDLDRPVGLLLENVIKELDLPVHYSHSGRVGVHFEYKLVAQDRSLEQGASLREQHVSAFDVLWLEFELIPFSYKAPRTGELRSATFRKGERGLAVAEQVKALADRMFRQRVGSRGLAEQH